jgi:hypothetical protein
LALWIEFLNSILEFFLVFFPASLKESIIGKSHNCSSCKYKVAQ